MTKKSAVSGSIFLAERLIPLTPVSRYRRNHGRRFSSLLLHNVGNIGQNYYHSGIRRTKSKHHCHIAVFLQESVIGQSHERIFFGNTIITNKKSSTENNDAGTIRRRFFTTEKQQERNEDDNYHIVKVQANVQKAKQKQSFRSMMRQYGPVFIGTYGTVYISTVLALFMCVQSDLIDAAYIISYLAGGDDPSVVTDTAATVGGVSVGVPDTTVTISNSGDGSTTTNNTNDTIVEYLEKYPWSANFAPAVETTLEKYPWSANFGLAWIMTKFTEPIRFGTSAVITPYISKRLGYGPTAQNSSPQQTTPSSSSPPVSVAADSEQIR